MITRHPAVAGDYYPRDEESLKQTLDKILRRVREPKRTVLGGLVPHSGIFYCGETQAHFYKTITGSPVFIIVGANHGEIGRPYAIMTKGGWKTPMGNVRIDSELAETIHEETGLEDDVETFNQDHSIEVQLPWIQHSFRPSFVPISIHGSDREMYKEIGDGIKAAARKVGRSICVIASSDLTRYGRSLGFTPVSGPPQRVLDWMERVDGEILDAVKERDVDKLFKAADPTNLCGLGAIATMLHSVEGRTTGGEILDYATTWPINHSPNSITSFGAVTIE